MSSSSAPLPLRWAVGGAVVLASAGVAFWHSIQPERQIRVHTQRLLQAIEGQDWAQVENLVAESYRDGWGLDKQQALAYSREIFSQFWHLRLQPQAIQVQPEPRDPHRQGQATFWFVIEEAGGPLANWTREQPFLLHWRRRGGDPYRWELTRLKNPALDLPPAFPQKQPGQR